VSEKQKISVLMSVYIKENPTFLKDAIESVQNQTLKPSELVLVEDGPLTPELYQVLDQLEAESDIPVKRYPLEQNQGLGLALRQGVLQCQYDIIARMDTDDIAVADRFEKQVQLMEQENLDLLGGHIAEFIENPDGNDTLVVILSSILRDYVIDDETRRVLEGDPKKDLFTVYQLNFIRQHGSQTQAVNTDQVVSDHCPNCGAPLKISAVSECDYCGANLSRSPNQWVLDTYDVVDEDELYN